MTEAMQLCAVAKSVTSLIFIIKGTVIICKAKIRHLSYVLVKQGALYNKKHDEVKQG